MSEKCGFKLFKHGITGWLLKGRRVDGGWYISMVRHLHVVICSSTDLLTRQQRFDFAELCHCLYKVHYALRKPVLKSELQAYQAEIDDLLRRAVLLCQPNSPSNCNSIKFHWPRHWSQTRREIGCAAMEKSLERKLGETHGKKNFVFTNSEGNKEVK